MLKQVDLPTPSKQTLSFNLTPPFLKSKINSPHIPESVIEIKILTQISIIKLVAACKTFPFCDLDFITFSQRLRRNVPKRFLLYTYFPT